MRAFVCKIWKRLSYFWSWERGAVTACGLRTEDPVFFLARGELRGEERGVGSEEYFTVDVLLPCRQFVNYCWVKLNVRSSQYQIHLLPTFRS